jgi:hypothetical protein
MGMSDRGISERLRRAFEDWRDRLPLSRDKKAFAGIMKERMKGRGGQKGVSYQTILAYFDGTYTPSLEWLNEAAAEFGVRLPWLALNEGPMTETLRERGRSAATAGNIDSLRLHVPSVHYNRGENAGGDYLNVGRRSRSLSKRSRVATGRSGFNSVGLFTPRSGLPGMSGRPSRRKVLAQLSARCKHPSSLLMVPARTVRSMCRPPIAWRAPHSRAAA